MSWHPGQDTDLKLHRVHCRSLSTDSQGRMHRYLKREDSACALGRSDVIPGSAQSQCFLRTLQMHPSRETLRRRCSSWPRPGYQHYFRGGHIYIRHAYIIIYLDRDTDWHEGRIIQRENQEDSPIPCGMMSGIAHSLRKERALAVGRKNEEDPSPIL